MNDAETVQILFKRALDCGFEGLILKNGSGYYKTGKATVKENLMYKVKLFLTYDAKVINVIQSTEVNPNVEKSINELGYSKTSRKKDDRILVNRVSSVIVLHNNNELKVTLAFTNEEREEIWQNKEKYIEYKAMEIGMKDGGLPRHPTSIRWRDDKK